MSDDIDRNLARLHSGQAAGAALQMIEQELDARVEAIQTRIIRILNDSEKVLDPQQATQGWIELHEIYKLRQSLTKRERVGQRAGEYVAPVMNN